MVGTVVMTAFMAFFVFVLMLHVVTNVMNYNRKASKKEYERRVDNLLANGFKYVENDGYFVEKPNGSFFEQIFVITKEGIKNMSRWQWKRFVKKNKLWMH